jgi:hypothetical protein
MYGINMFMKRVPWHRLYSWQGGFGIRYIIHHLKVSKIVNKRPTSTSTDPSFIHSFIQSVSQSVSQSVTCFVLLAIVMHDEPSRVIHEVQSSSPVYVYGMVASGMVLVLQLYNSV